MHLSPVHFRRKPLLWVFVKWRSRPDSNRRSVPRHRPDKRAQVAGPLWVHGHSATGAKRPARVGECRPHRENRDNHDPEREKQPLYIWGEKAVFTNEFRFLIFNLLNINIIGCNTIPA